MANGVFSSKLDKLPATLDLAFSLDPVPMARALTSGASRPAVAVGSGGSLVSAYYFAVIRRSLDHWPTVVQTPMEFVLDDAELGSADVWLFTARGENPDALAALRAARRRGAAAIHIVTSNGSSVVAGEASASSGAELHLAPVGEPRDGFLATHSLSASVFGLLRAASFAEGGARGIGDDAVLLDLARRCLGVRRRDEVARLVSSRGAASATTLILLSDPRLAPAAVAVETNCWEAAILPVQRTDFRNFAHGRHVWLSRREEGTVLLALTCGETKAAWNGITRAIPTSVATIELDYRDCGRGRNALAILDALVLTEALGAARGIDPGKPGAGPFAAELYDTPSLVELERRLTPAIRHKRRAVEARDDPAAATTDLGAEHEAVRARLRSTTFRGVVLDYDGTVVTTQGRYGPPPIRVADELVRLLDAGIGVAFATGRGGSAGEALRGVLPGRHHPNVIMGYYNGGHIRPLSIDIAIDRPSQHPDISLAADWLRAGQVWSGVARFKASNVQLVVDIAELSHPAAFPEAFVASGLVGPGRLKIIRSGHSYDICPQASCKTGVVAALAARLTAEPTALLCIGDSGGVGGNDEALLSSPRSLSVGEVCGGVVGSWTLFGRRITGPDALCLILGALKPSGDGAAKLDFGALDIGVSSG
jgi:hypothetical protein